MKHLMPLFIIAFVAAQCLNTNTTKKVAKAEVIAQANQTHREAADTLLADSTAPMKPLVYRQLSPEEAKAVLASINLADLIAHEYPDNGFYGTDRYRIEFIATKAEKTVNDASVYTLTGKNRYKKTVTKFEGLFEVLKVMEFTDPNLDTADISNMGITKTYTIEGQFKLEEDKSLNSSGTFAGTFKADFAINKEGKCEQYYYSYETPTKGACYVFDGLWTSYTNKEMSKPIIWARDIFAIGNDILKDFSYGERDVEINEKYRHLGWDTFWDGEEWWNDAVAAQ